MGFGQMDVLLARASLGHCKNKRFELAATNNFGALQ